MTTTKSIFPSARRKPSSSYPPKLARVAAALTALLFALALAAQVRMMGALDEHRLRDAAAASSDGRPLPNDGAAGGGEGGRRGMSVRRGRRPSSEAAGGLAPAANAPDALRSDPQQAELHRTLASSAAERWNLTSPRAVDLLERQFHRENDYDPRRDFFHFHHLYKSGGTSLSNLFDKTVGLPQSPSGKGYEGILPGSYESGNFDHEEALADINRRLDSGTPREELPYRASYAHTGLRPVYGPLRTKTGKFLTDQLPHRRLRAVAMLRDPTDFRASNHAMIMCGLNHEAMVFNSERASLGLAKACTPEEGMNVSALVDQKIAFQLEKCRKADEEEAQGRTPEMPNGKRKQCARWNEGKENMGQFLRHCRSPRDLLESKEYDKHYMSMFKGLMGRFHRGQKFTNSTAYGRMGYGFERAEDTKGYSIEAVEEYTLEDLGGLDLTISGAGDGVGPPEPDFIWFGITERMAESTILLYYTLRAKPLERTPKSRVQYCRPTSWWTEEDRATVKEREPADYAVWRAANAIMDVRLAKMKMEIRALLDAGETRDSLFHVDWDSLEKSGIEIGIDVTVGRCCPCIDVSVGRLSVRLWRSCAVSQQSVNNQSVSPQWYCNQLGSGCPNNVILTTQETTLALPGMTRTS
ncbi:hypothetical protein ACHAWF_007460 [Thalassiosira exigua]